MKTKLFLITLLLFACTFANAQSSKELEKKAKSETEKMVTALDLTDDQQTMIYRQNYTLMDQQMRFDKAENKTDAMKETMAKLKAQYKENVIKLLTDSQRETFKAWQEKSTLLKD